MQLFSALILYNIIAAKSTINSEIGIYMPISDVNSEIGIFFGDILRFDSVSKFLQKRTNNILPNFKYKTPLLTDNRNVTKSTKELIYYESHGNCQKNR